MNIKLIKIRSLLRKILDNKSRDHKKIRTINFSSFVELPNNFVQELLVGNLWIVLHLIVLDAKFYFLLRRLNDDGITIFDFGSSRLDHLL